MGVPDLWILNPGSPPGFTANREGFGGLGVVTPGRGGFVYAALRHAEAQAGARALGWRVAISDRVLSRGARFSEHMARARSAPRILVSVSLQTREHDLALVSSLRRERPRARIMVTGVAVDRVSWGEGIRVWAAPTAFGAPAAFENETQGDRFADPASWLIPDWNRVALGRSRRPGLYLARGCTHGCRSCPYVIATGRRQLTREPARVAEEFARVSREARARRMVFRDPTFGLAAEATDELLERLAKGVRTPFEIESRAEHLDGRIEALARAGCVEIKLGLESDDPADLEAMGRFAPERATAQNVAGYLERSERVLAQAAEHGIAVRLFALRGLSAGGRPDLSRFAARARWFVEKDLMPLPAALGETS